MASWTTDSNNSGAEDQANVVGIFERLFASSGLERPDKHLASFIQSLANEVSASAAALLTRCAGEIWEQAFFPKNDGEIRLTPGASDRWARAEAGHSKGESCHLISVPRLAPDEITGERLQAVLVLEHPPDQEPRPITGHLMLRIGIYLAQVLTADRERHMLQAHRRLAALQNRLPLAADIYYRATSQIRKVIRLSGQCGVFAWHGDSLQAVAGLHERLPEALGDRKNRERYRHRRVIVDSSVTKLGDDGVEAFVCDREKERYIAIAHSRQGKKHNRGAEPATATTLHSLLDAMEHAGLGSGRSAVVCPFVWRKGFLGALVAWAGPAGAFTREDALIAAELSRFCVPALARDSRIEEDLDLLEQTAQIQPDVSLDVNKPLQALLTTFCERFRVHRNADLVSLLPYNQKTGKMPLEMAASSSLQHFPSSPDPSSEGVLNHVLQQGEMEWHRSENKFQFSPNSTVEKANIKSFYAVALRGEDECMASPIPMGVLFVNYKQERRRYVDEHNEERPGFADYEKGWIRRYARIAQRYLSMYANAAWQRRVDQAVKQIYRSLIQDNADLRSTLVGILKTGMELVGATAGLLAVPSPEFYGLMVVHSENLVPLDKRSVDIKFGEGVTGACGKHRKSIVIPDSNKPETWPEGVIPLPWAPDSKSEVAVPLLSEDSEASLIGVLNVDSNLAINAFGEQEKNALEQLAVAGVIVVNLMRNLSHLQGIRKVSEDIKRLESEERIYEVLLREIAASTGAYSVIARGLDATGRSLAKKQFVSLRKGRLSEAQRIEELEWSNRSLPLTEGATAWAFINERTVVIPDVRVVRSNPKALFPDYPGMVYLPL